MKCRRVLVVLFATLCLGSVGCDREEKQRGEVQVLAAASFTEAFAELELAFEATRPHIDARLTFAGSQVLRLQIEQGAHADVFVSADEEHVRALRSAGHVAASALLAENELVVVTPNKGGALLEKFEHLPRAERLVVGALEVPVGRYTERLLERAERKMGASFVRSVRDDIVSRESNVRLVRAKVELGEADAAIVYRTDALASKMLRIVEVPPELRMRAPAHIVTVRRPSPSPWADEFVAFTLSIEGQTILARHGFAKGAAQ